MYEYLYIESSCWPLNAKKNHVYFPFKLISDTVTFPRTGMGHNFNKYEDDFITDLNTAYDYESIMHYRPLSFNKNDSIPTITTSIPYFNEVIGQRLDFSGVDITRLNRMYSCGECSLSRLELRRRPPMWPWIVVKYLC